MQSHFIYHGRRLHRSLSARLALLNPGFRRLLPPSAPLKTIDYPGDAQSKTLVVFLPGIGDLAEDFHRKGMIDAMRSHGISADAIAVDAHYGYYADKSIFERLTSDVIMQGRDAGYEQIWLAGISLGGLGATLYAAHHAANIDGLVLFAPYLGEDNLIEEIIGAGGLQQWNPGSTPTKDYQRILWSWVKRNVTPDGATLPVYLGYGTEDKFARANQLLSHNIPQQNVLAIPGAHDWRTWLTVWEGLLPHWKNTLP